MFSQRPTFTVLGCVRTWFAGCLFFTAAHASARFRVAGGRQHAHAPLISPLEQAAVHHASAAALEFPKTSERGGGGDDGNGGGGSLKPPTVHVSGACDRVSLLNTDFARQGFTADGKPYYQSDDGSRYLYYDKHCDGKEATPGIWIFDGNKPNTTAASDLDGHGKCSFYGYVFSTAAVPPEKATWQLGCGNGFTAVPLTIAEVPTYDGWIVCPSGSFCHGSGCSSNSTATGAAGLAPRDRWDPEKCPSCSCSAWDPTKCPSPAMGPDSNGECSCPAHHRCEDAKQIGGSSSTSSCVDDHLPEPPNDSCPFSNDGDCAEPDYCAAGTDCTDCGTCGGPTARASWHWNPAGCPSCRCEPWCDTSTAPSIGCKDLGLTSMPPIQNKNAIAVGLNGNRLTSLTDKLLFAGMADLVYLILNGNALATVDVKLFVGLLNLTTLYLSNNQLSELPPTLFANLTSLTALTLSGNALTSVDAHLFDGLSNLDTLYLGNNQLSVSPPTLFANLTSLTYLSLSGNALTDVDAQLFDELSKLTNLRLNNNQLSELPPTLFANLTSLTELWLYDNALTSVDAHLFDGLSNLTTLYLNNNQLSELPPTLFANLTSLTTLYLHDNALATVDVKLFVGLLNLTTLYLSNNQLSELPPTLFANLTSLTALTLSGNALTSVDAHLFDGLSNLDTLYLGNNQLSVSPPTLFANLTSLTYLSLCGNALTDVDAQLFDELSKLTNLRLNNNQLSELPPTLFANLTSLTELDLGDNALTSVDAQLLDELSNLAALYLSNNQLSELPPILFANLTSLTHLILRDNQLSELPPTLFADLKSLIELDLSSNRISTFNQATFSQIASTLQALYVADNNIRQVDAVLESMLQHHNLVSFTMEGNPSTCWRAADTYQNPSGSGVCVCAPGFEYVPYHTSTATTTVPAASTGNHSAALQPAKGYLCQELEDAVVIPPSFVSLRSKQFRLRGPQAQMARSVPQQSQDVTFLWNAKYTNAGDVTITLAWDPDDNATAVLDWHCNKASCKENGINSIKIPPPDLKGSSIYGQDGTSGQPVIITYTVVATSPRSASSSAPAATIPKNQTAIVRMVYSSFHLPFQFEHASPRIIPAVAGRGLTTARTFRINTTAVVAPTSNLSHNVEWLNATATVEPNPLIPTSITFSLVNNTCKGNITNPAAAAAAAAASGVTVREIYDRINRDDVVGWEVAVGDPIVMAKIENGTMQPCTAVLQATDGVTGENMTVATIKASVQDCYDNLNPLNLTDTQWLSCNGQGTCNPDADPYDGKFMGCNCDDDWAGDRCNVPASCDKTKHKAYNSETRECGTFKLVSLQTRKKGRRSGNDYIDPDNAPVYPPNIPIYTVYVGASFHISPLEINTSKSGGTTVSAGTVADIRYILQDEPDGFYVSSKSGEIVGEFYADEYEQYQNQAVNVTLYAVDKNNVQVAVETMQFIVKPKPLDKVWLAVAGISAAVVVGIIFQRLQQRYLTKKDAKAALLRAFRAYGLLPPSASGREQGTISINSGDLVGVTTTPTAAFVNLDAVTLLPLFDPHSDTVPLLDIAAPDASAGYAADQQVYEDDDDGDGTGVGDVAAALVPTVATTALGVVNQIHLVSDDSDYSDDNSDGGGGAAAAPVPTVATTSLTTATNSSATKKKSKQRRKGLSKFVAPTISLGKSTLAAKGLDTLLGVDPKTYMHVKRKVKVMLKEFAKGGTPEDNRNITTLLNGTYKHPPNSDGSPLTADDIRGQSITMEELMASDPVQGAGLERHHVLALRLYTTSSYRSINNPMRQSPPVLPHPFAATLYYISDALSKLRELQGKDLAVRNESRIFWRGMKDLQITDTFVRTGGSEMACMSTTSSRQVAEDFAFSKSPLLFKFVSNSFMSHGADIGFLSVYPGEKEVLYPPLTYLRPIRLYKETIGGAEFQVAEVEPVFPK